MDEQESEVVQKKELSYLWPFIIANLVIGIPALIVVYFGIQFGPLAPSGTRVLDSWKASNGDTLYLVQEKDSKWFFYTGLYYIDAKGKQRRYRLEHEDLRLASGSLVANEEGTLVGIFIESNSIGKFEFDGKSLIHSYGLNFEVIDEGVELSTPIKFDILNERD